MMVMPNAIPILAGILLSCCAFAKTDLRALQNSEFLNSNEDSELVNSNEEESPKAARSREQPDLTDFRPATGQILATRGDLRDRAESVNDMSWLPASAALGSLLPWISATRSSILAEKNDAGAYPERLARINAFLAAEAAYRVALVTERWLDRPDGQTDIFASLRSNDPQLSWVDQDTSADLFPYIVIATQALFPDRISEIRQALVAGQVPNQRAPDHPDDLVPSDLRQANRPFDYRMFPGEYGKDGLLPLLELLGPDPWLGLLRDVADTLVTAPAVPSRHGPIPAHTSEVNGDALQVLARAYFATHDDRYFEMADRNGRAYVEDMLPMTDWLPAPDWDFLTGEPIGQRRLRLSDHGNEIIAGLVNWHWVESIRQEPGAPAHRRAIRRMLDRIMEKGRNPDGMWYRVMDIPSGYVSQNGLTDNWGYLVHAYLAQAELERTLPGGDVSRAERYEWVARDALSAIPSSAYAYYPWQRGAMDGYADSIEGAISLLSRFPDANASRWVDAQMAVLFGFQDPSGRVEDNYLDGDFVRTALQYQRFLTRGVWLEPWDPRVLVGAADEQPCLTIATVSTVPWQGRLHFDRPRSVEALGLPGNLARINEWSEFFTVSAARTYTLTRSGAEPTRYRGEQLSAGVTIALGPHQPAIYRVCPD